MIKKIIFIVIVILFIYQTAQNTIYLHSTRLKLIDDENLDYEDDYVQKEYFKHLKTSDETVHKNFIMSHI